MTLEEPAYDTGQRPVTDLLRKTLRDLRQREVGLLGDPAEDQGGVGIDPVRAQVAPALVRFKMAPLALPRHPTHRGRNTNPKPRRSLPTRSTSLNSIHNTATKIDRKSFGHQSLTQNSARSFTFLAMWRTVRRIEAM